jgi:hypothetical protein
MSPAPNDWKLQLSIQPHTYNKLNIHLEERTLNTQVKRLASNYGIKGSIDAYTSEGEELKRKFLRDATAFLKAVGAKLAESGLTEMEVFKNAAGIAVSGEVYGWFAAPEAQYGIHVQIGGTCLGGILGRSTDAVAIRATWRQIKRKEQSRRAHRRTLAEGNNNWLDANLHSDAVAQSLRDILAQAPEQGPLSATWINTDDVLSEACQPREQFALFPAMA